MDDDRAQWSLQDDSANDDSWRPEAGSREQQDGEWSTLPAEQSDWAYDESQQAGRELYRRQDVYQMPDPRAQFPADQYQLQVSPEGLYDWQRSPLADPMCPQHGYQTYPGFAGYPGYQDSQGYQTALANPLYDRQQEADLFSNSQRPFTGEDDEMNACPLGPGMCRNMDGGFPTGPPIDDDDDDHPPGSPRSN